MKYKYLTIIYTCMCIYIYIYIYIYTCVYDSQIFILHIISMQNIYTQNSIYIQNSDLNHVFFDDVINFMRFFIFSYLLFQGFTGKRTLEIHIFFYMFNISYIT